jgi:hypothetical protein
MVALHKCIAIYSVKAIPFCNVKSPANVRVQYSLHKRSFAQPADRYEIKVSTTSRNTCAEAGANLAARSRLIEGVKDASGPRKG